MKKSKLEYKIILTKKYNENLTQIDLIINKIQSQIKQGKSDLKLTLINDSLLHINSIDNIKQSSNLILEKNNIVNQKKDIELKVLQINEELRMLKEDKIISNDNINDIISKKESLEEIQKIIINNIIESSQYKLRSSYTTYFSNINKKKQMILNIQYKPAINKSQYVYIYTYEISKINVNKIKDELYQILNTIIKDKNEDVNDNKVNSNNNNETFIEYIDKEFDILFLSNVNINEYITSISYKILKYLFIYINNNNNLDVTHIENIIKICIKINNYEYIIQNELTFINHEYKGYKKKLLKKLEEYKNDYKKLNEKVLELDIMIKNINDTKDYTNIYHKQNLNDCLFFFIREKINLNQNYNSTINEINQEINNINKKIDIIKNNNNKINEINKYEKINELKNDIDIKYQTIQSQFDEYKKKHDNNNMPLYNKLLSSINRHLKSNTKKKIIKNQTFYSTIKNPLNQSIDSIEAYNTTTNDNNISGILTDNHKSNNKYISLFDYSRNTISNISKHETETNEYINTSNDYFKLNTNNYNNWSYIIKSNKLYKSTNCYYRPIYYTSEIYDPLINSNCISKFNFIQCKISIINNALVISESYNKKSKLIKLNTIFKTLVSNSIKNVFHIHKKFLEYQYLPNLTKNIFNSKIYNDIHMTEDNIIKALHNQLFNFLIVFNNNDKIELLFKCYDDANKWLNGLESIIKCSH